MSSDWYSRCGINYRFYENGAIEVEGSGFPAWGNASAEAGVITKSWQKWGSAITAASSSKGVPIAWIVAIMHIESAGNANAAAPCEPTYCPAIWNAGGCASQGGTEKYCAGGLMAFISATAKKYGKTIDYYMAHPEEQIMDAADLFAGSLNRNNGDACASAKQYNGGSVCGGGGLVGMGGQGDYVSKFIRATNTFLNLNLPEAQVSLGGGVSPALQGILVAGMLGAVAYMFADMHWRISDRILDRLGWQPRLG